MPPARAFPPLPPPLTSSIVPPILQNVSRIDSADNPAIMAQTESSAPVKRWQIPLLRLKVQDVCSEGASAFFAAVNAERLLKEAVIGVLEALYTPKTAPTSVRSVTLVLRSMSGVAYTTGSDLDSDHKEIHFSTDYIQGVHERSSGKQDKDEILGVIRHEMVHCFQYNGKGTCIGGLIEGIADWVRLQAGFVPPHWAPGGGNDYDDGYQNTAYFLQYLEDRFGGGTVPKMNEWLRDRHYSDKLWLDIFKEKPKDLWKQYKQSIEEGERKKEQVPKVIPVSSTTEAETKTIVSPNLPSSTVEPTSKNSPVSDSSDYQSTNAESFVHLSDSAHESTPVNSKSKLDDRTVSLFQISEMRLLARGRLCKLTCTSRDSTELKRFIKNFESLIDIIDPQMTDQERKLLFEATMQGEALQWLLRTDQDSSKTFAEIKSEVLTYPRVEIRYLSR